MEMMFDWLYWHVFNISTSKFYPCQIHVDRHADIQEKDLDERMHTTPYFHATNLPNVDPKNLVQIGIGGWQVPRPAVANMIDRETNIFTMDDIENWGIDKVAEMALERAWDGTDAVYMSYDIDSIEAAFVPGTGWVSSSVNVYQRMT